MAQKGVLPKLSALPKNFQDWEIGDNYDIVKQVGSGSYGYVVEAIQKSTGKKVAIKRCNGLFDDLIDCKRILREIILLRKLDHPNLISIIEIIPPKDKDNFESLYIVMEYCQSDLKKLFKSPIHLEPLHLETLAYNILCGLKYLHSAEVLHRDLKPANVLINEDCSVKICDFGLARSVEGVEGAHIYDDKEKDNSPLIKPEEKKEIASELPKKKKLMKENSKKAKKMNKELTTHVVTRWYRAPEIILLEKDYTSKIDVWSVGCIFGELQGMLKENAPTFMDRSPLFPGTSCFPLSPDRNATVKKSGFPQSSSDQLSVIFQILGTPEESTNQFITDKKALEYVKSFKYVKKVDFKDIYPATKEDAIDFLEKTVRFSPKERLTIEEALNHPIFTKVRDPAKEKNASGPVVMEIENVKDEELTTSMLRNLFLEEINFHQKK